MSAPRAAEWALSFVRFAGFGKQRQSRYSSPPMPTPVTIAHLTDVHLGPIAGFTPRYWNVKRLLGYANWLRNRRQAYQMAVLDRIVADLRAQAPDHIAVTGDLVNIGLPQEHINALAWLESLGRPEHVTVIPGNHDIYSRLRGDPGTGALVGLHGVLRARGRCMPDAGEAFPFVRMLDRVAIIGVNSAVPTPPLVASGRLGERAACPPRQGARAPRPRRCCSAWC